MSRNTGTFNFAANFEGLLKAPIDARQLAGTYADLTGATTWNASGSVWLYNGAIVVVGNDPTPTNNGVYWLCDATNYALTSSWVKVGSGSGTLTGATNGLSVSGQNVCLGGTLTNTTTIIDSRITPIGIEYGGDYSSTFGDYSIVSKKYVDSIAMGLDPKLAVNVATTINLTYPFTGLTTIDGIALNDGDRVLVKDQSGTTGNSRNGIYVATGGTWTRALDFDASGETVQGSLIPVITGNTHGNTIWVLITPNPVIPDVSGMTFTLFSTVTLTAGNNIDIIGSTIDVNISGGTLGPALANKLDVSVYQSYTGTTQPILNLALTGATNGLTAVGRDVILGGTLTGDTIIETSASKLYIGTASNMIKIDTSPSARIVIGDESLSNNYICTSPSATEISSGIGDLNLCSNNIIIDGNNLNYVTHPLVWSNDTQIVDKKYVDDNVTGNTLYTCASPSTCTVGGIIAGTILTGKTTNELLKEILVPYLSPTFSSFSNSISTTVEVGCQITGSIPFTFAFTNSSNVCATGLYIKDVSLGANLNVIACPTTSPQSVTITTKTFVSCGDSQIWCGCAKNTCSINFGSAAYTTTAYLPYYWGKCTCPGAPGTNRPVGDAAMVTSGTKVLAAASGDITINFAAVSGNDYLWFAIPSSVLNKNCWCVNPSIYGTIGGAVSAGGNLFPAPDYESISVTTACWTANYDIYISNKQSVASTLKMGNV
jgi:hypothetical protein